MPLTDTAIKALKPADKPFKKSDGGGLYIWVTPKGTKTWRMDYRFVGVSKTLTIGRYPGITLADARKRRDEAKMLIANGEDPASKKKLDRLRAEIAQGNTFGAIAKEWLERSEKNDHAPSTVQKHHWLMSLVLPDLGHRPIEQISSAEVLMVLRRIEARGTLETARRLRSTIGSVFRYGIATARASNDPTIALKGALLSPKVKSRAAITDPIKFGELLRAIEAFEGQPVTRAALRLLPLLFCRPGELRNATWDQFDLEQGTWTIPAEITKMRREHKKPLARQSIEILKTLQPITGDRALVFPGIVSWRKPISENTLNVALRRLGYSKEEMTSHGFRASASTILNESGRWDPDAIEREQGRIDSNESRRAYNRGKYWEERISMVQWWADKCEALRDGAKIIQLSQ